MAQTEQKPDTFAGAFLKLQVALKPAIKDASNPAFKGSKYADLSAVWDAIREPLQTNNFAVIQVPNFDDRDTWLETTLIHVPTGDKMVGRYPLRPTKSDPQGYGSALTYARRYSLTAMLGVIADDDDDGNAASAKSQPERQQSTPVAPKNETPQRQDPSPDKERARKASDWCYEAKSFVLQCESREKLDAWHRANANNIAAAKPLAPNAHTFLLEAIEKREGDLHPMAAE